MKKLNKYYKIKFMHYLNLMLDQVFIRANDENDAIGKLCKKHGDVYNIIDIGAATKSDYDDYQKSLVEETESAKNYKKWNDILEKVKNKGK